MRAPTTIKLELRSVKVLDRASQETPCYQAFLYVDGLKAAELHNEGMGGCDHIHWGNPAVRDRVDAYFAALPPLKTEWGDLAQSLEMWCHTEVGNIQDVKRVKRALKRKVIGLHNGKELHFKVPVAGLPHCRDILLKKYPGMVILNELNDADLLAAMQRVS